MKERRVLVVDPDGATLEEAQMFFQRYGTVDQVTTLGGLRLLMESWAYDAVILSEEFPEAEEVIELVPGSPQCPIYFRLHGKRSTHFGERCLELQSANSLAYRITDVVPLATVFQMIAIRWAELSFCARLEASRSASA